MIVVATEGTRKISQPTKSFKYTMQVKTKKNYCNLRLIKAYVGF